MRLAIVAAFALGCASVPTAETCGSDMECIKRCWGVGGVDCDEYANEIGWWEWECRTDSECAAECMERGMKDCEV